MIFGFSDASNMPLSWPVSPTSAFGLSRFNFTPTSMFSVQSPFFGPFATFSFSNFTRFNLINCFVRLEAVIIYRFRHGPKIVKRRFQLVLCCRTRSRQAQERADQSKPSGLPTKTRANSTASRHHTPKTRVIRRCSR